jgi:uncharacterized OsmC-like protein
MSDLHFSVQGNAGSATLLNVQAREFSIVVDEPPALGGSDLGANPVEVLLAGYAGCLNVIAHLTARELGIELRGLKIVAGGDINPARFLGHDASERAGFKSISVDFIPDTDAPQHVIDHWLTIIESRCPINDNLANPTPLKINYLKQTDNN